MGSGGSRSDTSLPLLPWPLFSWEIGQNMSRWGRELVPATPRPAPSSSGQRPSAQERATEGSQEASGPATRSAHPVSWQSSAGLRGPFISLGESQAWKVLPRLEVENEE